MFSPSTSKQVAEEKEADMKYVDRGDPSGWDFTVVNFIRDGAWHTLDLSSIIPVEAAAHPVHLRFEIYDAETLNLRFALRKKGNLSELNILSQKTQVLAKYIYAEGICMCNANREMEYHSAPLLDYIFLTIRGWWID